MYRKKLTAAAWGAALLFFLCAGAASPGVRAAESAPAQQETPLAQQETTKAPEVKKVKRGLEEEDGKIFYYKKGKKLKKTWKTITRKVNGKKVKERYYFGKKGAACTSVLKWKKNYYTFSEQGVLNTSKKNKLFQVGERKYCPDADGKCQKGWLIVGKKLYYADPKGRIVTKKKVAGIKLTKSGAAKSCTATKLKILAIKTVAKKTKPTMTKAQKLKACWNYMVSSKYFRYSYRDPDINKKGWQKTFAYNMLKSRAGSCESFACAFAALACAIGYDPIIYYGRVPGRRDGAADGFTRHCWVKIDGEYYDPEAQFAGWMKGVYGDSEYPIRHKILKVFHFE